MSDFNKGTHPERPNVEQDRSYSPSSIHDSVETGASCTIVQYPSWARQLIAAQAAEKAVNAFITEQENA